MGALAATDWTIAHVSRGSEVGMLHKSHIIDLTIGDGIKTYPTNGIPLPTLSALGFNKVLLFGEVMQPANGYVPSFDFANHKIKLLSGAGTAHTHTFTGDALATHTHTENAAAEYSQSATTGATSGGTPAGTIGSGGGVSPAALGEVANTVTPALFTVRIKLTGL